MPDNNGVIGVFAANGTRAFNLTISNPPISQPYGLWVDAAYNVLVTDPTNSRIVKFYSSQSGFVTVSPLSGFINGPVTVAVDSSNAIYVADTGNKRALKLQSSTSTTISQTYAPPSSVASLNQPQGVCLDSANSVYVVDSSRNRVLQFSNNSTYIRIITNPSGTLFNQPFACVVDSYGFLYVSNTYGPYINKVASNGSQVALFTAASSSITVVLYQLALDSSNALYAADNYRIVKYNSTTGAQLQAFILPNGSGPRGVAVDLKGLVYASTGSFALIYVFSPSGVQLSILATGFGSLPLGGAQGLAVDSYGRLYVADTANNRIVIFQTPASSSSSTSSSSSSSVSYTSLYGGLLSGPGHCSDRLAGLPLRD